MRLLMYCMWIVRTIRDDGQFDGDHGVCAPDASADIDAARAVRIRGAAELHRGAGRALGGLDASESAAPDDPANQRSCKITYDNVTRKEKRETPVIIF